MFLFFCVKTVNLERPDFFEKKAMIISEIITISPNVQSGDPVFTATRVPIRNLFDYLKAGDSMDEFLHDFPSVEKMQVVHLLTYFVSAQKTMAKTDVSMGFIS